MPATGLKIAGTGACLPWCSISSSFENSFEDVWASRLWVSGVLGLEFGPILAWYRFSTCWRICGRLKYFFLLMMHQMFSIGERSGLQAGQFSTRTLLLRSHAVCNSCSVWFCIVPAEIHKASWNRRRLEGSICCSKTFIYLSAFIVPSKTCKLPYRMHLCNPHTIRDAGFWTERW